LSPTGNCSQHEAWALHVGYRRLHTLRMCILIAFPVVARTRLHVTLCLVLYYHISLLSLLQAQHYLSQEIRQQDRKKVSFVKNIIRTTE